ncbi:MAG: ABC transporter ATP-binding protein, partial [Negativicoccus succinicivorans]|uniref:energy-coupling factor ABC transporter ATP-binding protein n=1 Tax=Negativicoccus succinicivorans TaxID=620903 RepID=UPI002908B75C
MLKTEHLRFAYPDGCEVIHDLSLAFAAGEITALVGKNGSGKTTLTRLLMGLERPTSGRIELNGRELTKLSASERSHFLGYVFQQADRQLFCTTVYDEIAFGPLEQGRDRVETRAKAEAALKLCGLEEDRDAYPPLLSRAKKQRVALASAVALGAEFL